MSVICTCGFCTVFRPWRLSWAQLGLFIPPVVVPQYPSFPGIRGGCELHELFWWRQLIHWSIETGAVWPCYAPSDQTWSVCAQVRCQEIHHHCWTSLSHLQPVPFASGPWQAGHQKQMTGISLAVAALLSGGRVREPECTCCAVPTDWIRRSVYVHAC